MLARTLEKAGLATILVTNMPFWAEKIGVPRTYAVEHPFGHILGQPDHVQSQMSVIKNALKYLIQATVPGEICHGLEKWPNPTAEAIQDWQPQEPSPVIEYISVNIREILKQSRNGL